MTNLKIGSKSRAAVCAALLYIASAQVHAAAPAISINAPHGGELFLVGSKQIFSVVSKFKSITIELSRDGGATFEVLGTIDNRNPATRNTFNWTVTGPATDKAIVLATASQRSQAVTQLSGSFIITTGVAIGVGIPADNSVTTPKLADGSVTNPKLAEHSVTNNKIDSGTASANFVLGADGNGGALWEPIQSLLPTTGTPYVLKSGDTITGALQITAPNTGLTVNNNVSLQGIVAVGPNPPTNGQLSLGATTSGFNMSIFDANPNLLFSDKGTGNSAGFIQFRDSDQSTVRGQIAAFSSAHATKPNWLSVVNFKAAPLILGTNNQEQVRIEGSGNVGVGNVAPTSKLSIGGSLSLPIRSSAINTSLDATDFTVILSVPAISAALPTAAGISGRVYVIKNRSGAPVTVNTVNSETIDGVTSISVAGNTSAQLQSDGTNWIKLN